MWNRPSSNQAAGLVTPRFTLSGLCKVLLLVALVWTAACDAGVAGKYPGEWRKVDSEHTSLIISKEGDAYVVKVLNVGWSGNYDQISQFPATFRDGQLKVAGPMGEVGFLYVSSSDHIVFAGNEYARKIK